MNIQSLLNSAIILDIETYSKDKNGKEIDIKSNFDLYIENAIVKWVGLYDLKDNKEYYLQAEPNREFISNLLRQKYIFIHFNGEEFDYPILVKNGYIDEYQKVNHIDCMKILGANSFRDKKGFAFKGRGELMGYKFKSNSLRCMAETMNLTYQKSTIDYKIFQKDIYTVEEQKEICYYLKNDILATKGLFDKLWDYWLPFTELIDWKYVENFSWIKSSIASLIYKSACFAMGIEPTYSEQKSKIEEMGGRVLEPKYEEARNVWYVDFSSLYPHIMTMFNLFAESTEEAISTWHGNSMFQVKGYYDISYRHPLAKEVEKKLKERLSLKAKDKDNPMVYTLKIWLNGLYGCTRSSIFEKVHTKNIGWDCCWLGQQIQEFTQKELEKYGFESIAGDTDSVPKDTPILIKYLNQLQLVPIEDLFNAPKTNSASKISLINKNILVLTDKGWSKIKYIYRHKTKKKMYRIATRKGFIEVSEDHSLVVNNDSIKPSELKIGDNIELIKHSLPNNYNIDKDLCWLLGFWLAEGTTGYYKYSNGVKYSWALYQKKIEPLLKAQQILLKFGLNTKILNTLKSSNCHKLVPDNKNIKVFYEIFKEWCLSKTGYKKIPSFILMADKESKQAFLTGYLLGDGSIDKKDKSIHFGSIDKPLFSGLCKIFEALGEDYSLKIRKDKPNYISCRILKSIPDSRINIENKILKIETYTNNDNIYDIETENHHFCGGIGNVNLHNSLFILSKENKHLDKDYINVCLKQIVKKILANVPFPVETFNIDIEHFIPYIMFPFSEQAVMDEQTGKNKKDKNKLIKERKGIKKSYLYLYEKNNELKVKLVGLPIKKDGATELGMKFYKEILEPKILEEKTAKFPKEFIDGKLKEYLQKPEIIQLISREFKVKPANTYKIESSIYAQISNAYFSGGEGIINLVKNSKFGKVGKGEKYCSVEDAIQHKLTIADLDLEKLENELEPFLEYKENLTQP